MPSSYIDETESKVVNKAIKMIEKKIPVHGILNTVQDRQLQPSIF